MTQNTKKPSPSEPPPSVASGRDFHVWCPEVVDLEMKDELLPDGPCEEAWTTWQERIKPHGV